MKLPLCLAFAFLLAIQGFEHVSAQSDLSPDEGTMTFSGDGDNQSTNHTEDETTDPAVTSYKPEDDETGSGTLNPLLHSTLNNSNTLSSDKTNETTTLSYNMSSTVTTNPSLRPAVTNHTGLNTTTSYPKTQNSTASGSLPSNQTTVTHAFEDTQNSTSGHVNVNFTTTVSPNITNATVSSSESPTRSTSAATTTITQTTVLKTGVTSVLTTHYNRSGGSIEPRDNSERGLASDMKQKVKSQAWGVILGVVIAVGIVALVVYVIKKRRSYRDFAHRKLEEMPPEPVLRLDNTEPLDMKFDGFAYYNPGLQGDNIQMTSFPKGNTH